MTKYIIGEIFSSSRATLYTEPSDQTVILTMSGSPLDPENLLSYNWQMRTKFLVGVIVITGLDVKTK